MADGLTSRWMQFGSWLETQRRDPASPSQPSPRSEGSEVAASDGGASPQPSPRDAAGASSPPPAPAPRQLARAALSRDCRTETRLVDGASGRQEMTVVLAARGVPLRDSPLVSAKQAGALVAALCEPLVRVQAGRLTRRLDAPTVLRPAEGRGALSLWLLPNDDLSLVWQEAAGAAPQARQDCDVSMWEELARFPAGAAQLVSDEPLVTIHMLRGDAGGRAFYIKPREDVQDAHNAAGPLAQLAAAAADSGVGPLDGEATGRRMYFWLSDRDLDGAVHALGRLKSMLKRPPTLSKRAGVSEAQLAELAAWLHRADAAAAEEEAQEPSQHAQQAGAAPALAAAPGGGSEQPAAAGAVSATAAAVYRDRRFNVSCPCSISVGVSMRPGAATPEAATAAATAVAEEAARRAVERAGPSRVEERICESLIRSVREQRARSKADRQRRREAAFLRQHAADAQPLIRAAVEAAVRTGGVRAPSMAVMQQLAAVAAGAAAHGHRGSSCCSADGADGALPAAASPPAGEVSPQPGQGGSRVTLENLQGLLNSGSIEARGAGEHGGCAARAASAPVALSDHLADLLHREPHAE